MQREEAIKCLSTAENLMLALIEANPESADFDLDHAIKHLGRSVSLVAGQIAAFQREEHDVEIRETMIQVLTEIKDNLAHITEFQETIEKTGDAQVANLH